MPRATTVNEHLTHKATHVVFMYYLHISYSFNRRQFPYKSCFSPPSRAFSFSMRNDKSEALDTWDLSLGRGRAKIARTNCIETTKKSQRMLRKKKLFISFIHEVHRNKSFSNRMERRRSRKNINSDVMETYTLVAFYDSHLVVHWSGELFHQPWTLWLFTEHGIFFCNSIPWQRSRLFIKILSKKNNCRAVRIMLMSCCAS